MSLIDTLLFFFNLIGMFKNNPTIIQFRNQIHFIQYFKINIIIKNNVLGQEQITIDLKKLHWES